MLFKIGVDASMPPLIVANRPLGGMHRAVGLVDCVWWWREEWCATFLRKV